MEGLAASLAGLGAARLVAAGQSDDAGRAGAGVRCAAAWNRPGGRGDGMVARPPLKLRIEPMTVADVPDVHRIESASFPVPWPRLRVPPGARDEPHGALPGRALAFEMVAYAGLWLMVDEAHITTFAVLPDWRRRGVGGRLMVELMRLARDLGSRVMTLEVRLSNQPARALYGRFGFRPVGIRPRYYSDNGEDALIMTTDAAGHGQRWSPASSRWRGCMATRSGRILAVETSCDETAVAVVENGRRIVTNVVASQVALHGATGGIVPEVAARAHLRWMIPVLEKARSDAGIDDWSELEAVAVTEGPGLAGSLLVGITMAKTLAWVHDLPLVPVNHLEGHIYAAWLLDPGEDEKPAPEFPIVALVVSGGHTFLVEMTDHLRYRLLGQTVDDAAGEAFDKVGRLLGLPYPGGPAIMRAAAGAQQRDREFPRAWLGDTFDFSFSGLKTAARREVARELGIAGQRDGLRRPGICPSRRSPSWPTASRNRSSTCSRPRPSARPRTSAPRRSSSVGEWPRTRSSGRGSRARLSRAASASSCRAPGCAPTTPR